MRLLAISDIHGCLNKLKSLLDEVKYNPNKDKLILLGDYVDRGQQSIETLLYVGELIDNGAIAILGNHDEMFKELLESNQLEYALSQRYYYQQGTAVTIEQYLELNKEKQKRVIDILNNLKLYYEYENYIFVHAGLDCKKSIDNQKYEDYFWIRNEFYKNKGIDNKIIIFGHTPTCNLNSNHYCTVWVDEKYNDKIGIDCACVYGGNLACLDLTNSRTYYV